MRGQAAIRAIQRLAALALGALILSLTACGPAGVLPPTATPVAATATPVPSAAATARDTGPVDAVTTAYEAALAAGLPAQLRFFACVYGGAEANQFSDLFAGLAILALTSSGVSADEFAAAFGTSFDAFEASEKSRTAYTAIVHVSVRVTLTPDINKLREMMRRGATDLGSQFDEAAIDAALNAIIGSAHVARTIEHDVEVTQDEGSWLACA